MNAVLESIRAFSEKRGIVGAETLYTTIDDAVRQAIDGNKSVETEHLVQLMLNVFVGFTAAIGAFFAVNVIPGVRDEFITAYQQRFSEGVREAMPDLVDALTKKIKEEDANEPSEDIGTSQLH